MYLLLCRIMVVIFLINCLATTPGWGQARRRATKQSLDAQVNRQVMQAEKANRPAFLFAQADSLARKAHNEHFAQADSLLREQTQQRARTEFEKELRKPSYVAQPDALYVAPKLVPSRVPIFSSAKGFLDKVANNELEFKDLIEYADPMDPSIEANDLTTIAYAAEIIGNSIDEAAQLDPSLYDINELQSLLPQVEARLIYRLALLGYKSPSYNLNKTPTPVSTSMAKLQDEFHNSIAKTTAVGSIRIALLKVHRFYQKKGLPDPADEYQKQMLVKQAQEPTSWAHNLQQPAWSERGTFLIRNNNNDNNTKNFLQEATRGVNQHGNIASFQKNFLDELRGLKNQDPEEGSGAFEHLQVLADYAVAYALEYNPTGLRDIVKVFDAGVKETDFKQKYAPILNAIFTSVFENTRYSAMGESKTKQVLSMLQEFSDPQKYSLPTRIFALEAAGLLFRPFNQETLNTPQQNSALSFFAPMNLNKPDEKLRETFAWRVSEIYCPLSSEILNSAHLAVKQTSRKLGISSEPILNSTVMSTYGLKSDEMQVLADKLAYIYDGFYDIHTAFFEDANAPASTRARANYPASKCHIVMRNPLNRLKRKSEEVLAFTEFSAEALFWVYGGELFSLLGTAFRLTRGAVAALPKARKAYTLAARGEKVAAFNNEIRGGARFANWVGKNNNQGYFVDLLVEKKPTPVKGAPMARTTEVGPLRTAATAPEIEVVPVRHTYQLEGQYSRWNPKRWLGMTPDRKIVGMRVTRLQPNFNTTVAQATFETPVYGFHSMKDIEKAWSQLRLVTDPTVSMAYETKPYWSAMLNLRQVQTEQSLLQGLEKSFKNSMDVWVPVTDLPPTYEFMASSTLKGERAWTAQEIAAHTKWWNTTRWGNPYSQFSRSDMPVFVSARSAAIPNTPIPGGIDLPANLPGFTINLESIATGQWHQQAFKAFFKPMNWSVTPTNSHLLTNYGTWGRRLRQAGRTFNRVLLPDYVPTPLFWQVAKTSPIFAAKMIPQLTWSNPFVRTSAFFAALMGLDYAVHPAYRHWLEGEANQDAQAELNKYGNTFSEQEAKRDEKLMRELGLDTSDKRAMTLYQDVLQAQPDQKEGTSIAAPIVMTRRAMGMELVDEGTKENYAHQAQRINLNRARLKQMRTAMAQTQQATQERLQAEQTFVQDVQRAYQEQLAAYPRGFAAVPQAKEQLKALFDRYVQQSLSAQTEQEQQQIDARFLEQRDQILLPVDVWDVVLQESDQTIQQAKLGYAQDADLITPAVEQQIRNIHKDYAQKYIRALDIKDDTQRQRQQFQLLAERNLALGAIWADLRTKWIAKHPEAIQNTPTSPAQVQEEPEDEQGYGVMWDENAADK